MTCTHGEPHMIHDTGARCPWCLHTIATGSSLPRLPVAAAGEVARHIPPGPAPAANPAPEVSAYSNGVGGLLPVQCASGAVHRRARNTDPDTSLEAAMSVTELRRRADHDLVLALLFEHGPLTDFDLARLATQRLGHMVKQTSLGVRRGELRDAGLVVDSGHKGKSDTGARAIRWALTDAGSREVAA